MMLLQDQVRNRLQAELVSRCRKNPRYSLRSFARFLSVEPSALSKVLNSKRRISEAFYSKISERLNWTPTSSDEFKDLNLDLFEAISNWYHFAILELTSIQGFKSNARWVSARLGISIVEVRQAVETLGRLGFLLIDKNGRWVDVSGSVTTINNKFTHAAFRKLQNQILMQASDALTSTPIEERDQSAMTMAIDHTQLAVAKEEIKKFRRKLCQMLQSGKRDSVYQLSISLFPVTKTVKSTQSRKQII